MTDETTHDIYTSAELAAMFIKQVGEQARKQAGTTPTAMPAPMCSNCCITLTRVNDHWECAQCRYYWKHPIKFGDKPAGIIDDHKEYKQGNHDNQAWK